MSSECILSQLPKKKRDPYFQVDFNTQDDYGFDDDAEIVVNKGRLFRVMATIVKATKEFLNDIDYKEKGIKKMFVFPSKSKKSYIDHIFLYKFIFCNINLVLY